MTDQQPKFCVNCKHIGRNGSGDAKQFRCFHPINVLSKSVDLITGNTVTEYRHDTCYTARLNYDGAYRCGPEGKWFEEAPPKIELPQGKLSYGPGPSSAADLLSQLDKLP